MPINWWPVGSQSLWVCNVPVRIVHTQRAAAQETAKHTLNILASERRHHSPKSVNLPEATALSLQVAFSLLKKQTTKKKRDTGGRGNRPDAAEATSDSGGGVHTVKGLGSRAAEGENTHSTCLRRRAHTHS